MIISAFIMKYDEDLDTLGLLCPLPVLKLSKRIRNLPKGNVIRMQSDDPAAALDVPHFCNEQGHKLEDATQEGDVLTFFVRRI